AGEDEEIDVLLGHGETRDRPGVGPVPGLRLALARERARPGVAHQDLGEHGFGANGQSSSDLPDAREWDKQGNRASDAPARQRRGGERAHGPTAERRARAAPSR